MVLTPVSVTSVPPAALAIELTETIAPSSLLTVTSTAVGGVASRHTFTRICRSRPTSQPGGATPGPYSHGCGERNARATVTVAVSSRWSLGVLKDGGVPTLINVVPPSDHRE